GSDSATNAARGILIQSLQSLCRLFLMLSVRRNALLCLAALTSLLSLLGCSERSQRFRTLAQALPANAQGRPEVLAAYQGWFGKQIHLQVGYSSQAPVMLP